MFEREFFFTGGGGGGGVNLGVVEVGCLRDKVGRKWFDKFMFTGIFSIKGQLIWNARF